MKKYLGLDYGERHVGVAISSDDGRYAFGRDEITYRTRPELLKRIKDFCRAEGITTIILGVPLDQAGQYGPAAIATAALAKEITASAELPVLLEDERFSSQLAAEQIKEAGKHTKSAKHQLHQLAAQSILQSYLDRSYG